MALLTDATEPHFKRVGIPIPTKSKDISVGQEMIDLGIVYKAITVVETVENLVDIELAKKKN